MIAFPSFDQMKALTASIKAGLAKKQNKLAPDDTITLTDSSAIRVALPTKALSREAYDALPEEDKNANVLYAVEEDEEIAPAVFSNPSLLINADFRAPINQRGLTEYAGYGYTVDCFIIDGGVTLKVTDDCIETTTNESWQSIAQILEPDLLESLIGRTVTLSCLFKAAENVNIKLFMYDYNANDRVHVSSYGIGDWKLASNTFVVPDRFAGHKVGVLFGCENADDIENENTRTGWMAVKLELGPVQTLARWEDGAWVLNDPAPNKALELLKCQRYFRAIDEIRAYVPTASDYIPISLNYPDMRTNPTVIVNGRIANEADITIEGCTSISSGFTKNSADHIRVNKQVSGLVKIYNVWLDANL